MEKKIKEYSVEVTIDEVNLLIDLLRLEAAFQLRAQLVKENDVNEKLLAITGVFDTYRFLDDQLFNIKRTVQDNIKQAEANNQKPVSILMLDYKALSFYKMLCTETVASGTPDFIKTRFEPIGPNLLNKLKKASPKEAKEVLKEMKDDIKVNILNNIGIA